LSFLPFISKTFFDELNIPLILNIKKQPKKICKSVVEGKERKRRKEEEEKNKTRKK